MLISLNPSMLPIIDLGLLNLLFDFDLIPKVIKATKHVIAVPIWKGYVLQPLGLLVTVRIDADIKMYIYSYMVRIHTTAARATHDSADGCR